VAFFCAHFFVEIAGGRCTRDLRPLFRAVLAKLAETRGEIAMLFFN
jgi:hypothetical protein